MTDERREEVPAVDSCDVFVVGCGPIGLTAAIEAKKRGLVTIAADKGCLVDSIYRYPTHMRFFSTSRLLEIGDLPFPSNSDKPTRSEALEYYRRVAETWDISLRLYEEVIEVRGEDGAFEVVTSRNRYRARKVVVATGFFQRPRLLGVPGEDLPKVSHFFREPHPYAAQDVLVVGSGNSAAQTALACFRHGARVTVAIRGDGYQAGVKYWIKPDIDNRIAAGEIAAYLRTHVREIRERVVVLESERVGRFEIRNDFVLALTGYMPDFGFLRRAGIDICNDDNLTPVHDPVTFETNRRGVYLIGVVIGGLETSRWFIENSRAHAVAALDHLTARL